jgi:uncharacterized protein YjbI with pentapeptide repeats
MIVYFISMVSGCNDIPADNPFDPSSSQELQVPGSLQGHLLLQTEINLDLAFERAQVFIVRSDLSSDSRIDAQLSVDNCSDDQVCQRFSFSDLVPATYDLTVDVSGMERLRVVNVQVGISEQRNLGELTLETKEVFEGFISGTVTTDPPRSIGYAGIEVNAIGTLYKAETNTNGQWSINLPPNTYNLSFNLNGYRSEELTNIQISNNQPSTENDTILVAIPIEIEGTVELQGNFLESSQAVSNVDIQLIQLGEESSPELYSPNNEGAFLIRTAPGDYTLKLSLDGYEEKLCSLSIEPNRNVDLRLFNCANADGIIPLIPRTLKLQINGTAQLNGQSYHAGIQVQVQNTQTKSFTDPNGVYRLEVPLRSEPYTLVFSREYYNNESATVEPLSELALDMALATRQSLIEVDAQPSLVSLSGQPGDLKGYVRLSLGFTEDIEGVDVSLYRIGESTNEQPLRITTPNGDGLYIFNDLSAGDYLVRYALNGFRDQEQVAQVIAGQSALLSTRTLSPDQEGSAAFIEGTVMRECALPPCDHSGILVEVKDYPFIGISNSEGKYRIEVLAGDNTQSYNLRFSSDGYVTQERFDIEVNTDEVTVVDTQILPVINGAVSIIASLSRYASLTRTQRIRVSLLDATSRDTITSQLALSGPEVNLTNVTPNEYILKVSAPGYIEIERPIQVDPGQTIFAGLFELQHQSEGPDAVPLRAQITLDDNDDYSGTQVQVWLVDSPIEIPFGQPIQTNAQGLIQVNVSIQEQYRLEIQREGYNNLDLDGPLMTGATQWLVAEERFQTIDGQELVYELIRDSLNGSISVTFEMTPSWLPSRERYANITILSTDENVNQIWDLAQSTNTQGNINSYTLNQLNAGTYMVEIDRLGFNKMIYQVSLNPENSNVDIHANLMLNNLAHARLDLSAVELNRQDFIEAIESQISFVGAQLNGINLKDIDLSGLALNLSDVNFSNANLIGANLSGLTLENGEFFGANLKEARLIGTILSNANFSSANLNKAVFASDSLDLNIAPCEYPNPSEDVASLDSVYFAQANLTEAKMKGVNLEDADLTSALLINADLENACLRDVNLTSSNLEGTDFRRANLLRAEMLSAILKETKLEGANLLQASLANTIIINSSFNCIDWPLVLGNRNDVCEDGWEPNNSSNTSVDIMAGSFIGLSLCGGDTEDWYAIDLQANERLEVYLSQDFLGPSRLSDLDEEGDSIKMEFYRDGAREPIIIEEVCNLLDETTPGCLAKITHETNSAGRYYVKLWREPLSDVEGFDKVYDLHIHITDLGTNTIDRGLGEQICTVLNQASFEGSNILGSDFSGAELQDAVFVGANISVDFNTTPTFTHQPFDCTPFRLSEDDCTGAQANTPQCTCRWVELSVDQYGLDPSCSELHSETTYGIGPELMTYCGVTPTRFVNANLDRTNFSSAIMNHVNLSAATFSNSNLENIKISDNSFFYGVNFSNNNLQAADFNNQVMISVNFENSDLTNAVFDTSLLMDINFYEADLNYTSFKNTLVMKSDFSSVQYSTATMNQADFSGSSINNSSFNNRKDRSGNGFNFKMSRITGNSQFQDTNLRASQFQDAYIGSDVNLTNANLYKINFSNAEILADLSDTDMNECICNHTYFKDTILDGANLSESLMNYAIFEGVSAESTDFNDIIGTYMIFKRSIQNTPSLRGAQFQNANLTGTRFKLEGELSDRNGSGQLDGFDLTDTNFNRAILVGARFEEESGASPTFSGSSFSHADLSNSHFESIRLTNVCLSNAYVNHANWSGVNLSASNLGGAQFRGTDLTSSSLIGACSFLGESGHFDGALVRSTRVCSGNYNSFQNQNELIGTPISTTCRFLPPCNSCN